MNRTEHELELMRLYLEGVASLEETQELESLIVKDASVRQDFLRYTHLDSALAGVRRSQPSVVAPRRSVWLSWHPLTAAAAGIVFGMFCTSMVFGFVVQRGVEKKTPLTVFEPSFEDTQMRLANGFPGRPGQWGGDAAHVVAAENAVSPKEGKFMLKLDPKRRGAPHMYQVLDLQSPAYGAGGEPRDIEISASFAAADPEASVRDVIRAFAFTEATESLDEASLETRDEAIASVTGGLDVTPGMTGWQTISVKVQVPRAARSLVLFFGVRVRDKAAHMAPSYLDDVHVSLLTTTTLP